ncbi:MAG: ATP-dependent Clp protease proteolytic subunit [Eubacteriales bacterium]|nr:ATP-dependent Clp protease proteolytic subunit [Eubacteriales bacterium]
MEPELPSDAPENNPPTTPEQSIVSTGSMPLPDVQSPIHCITIIGQIEGHMVLPPHNKTTKYEHILPMLIAIEESPDIKGFLVLLNTVGGDVEAGLAIAEMISGMTTPSVSIVLGGGHSIGVPLAVCTRYSFIVPRATMTIHPIRMNGLVIGVPQTYDYFNKMQERVVNYVVEHSQIDKATFTELMMRTGDLANDVGTILVGQEAVNCGLINEIGSLDKAMAKLKELMEEEK